MLKRNLAVVLVAGLVLGGGAVAYARGGASRPTLAAAVAADAGSDPAAADAPDPAARRAAVQRCVADLKGAGQRRGPEARQALRQCLADAGFTRAGPAARGEGKYALYKRAIHGDLIVRGKDGFENYTFDRGKVDSASADSITLTRPDGRQVTLTITSDTRHRGAWPPQAGKPAVVVSQSGRAVLVAQKPQF